MKKLLLVLITCFAVSQNLKSAFLGRTLQGLKNALSFSEIALPAAPENIIYGLARVIQKEKEILAQKTAERQAVTDRQIAIDNLPVKLSKNRMAFNHTPSKKSTAAVVMLRRFGAKYPRK
jgi:hypothetical protein